MTGLAWQRSTRCEVGDCVEVASDGDTIRVRDSKHPNGAVLSFTQAEWDAFRAGVHAGEFDPPAADG